MPPPPRALVLAATLAVAPACAERTSVPQGVTVTDSAGVAVVAHAFGAIEAAPRWVLGEAALEVGGEGDIPLFRVADVVPLAGGRVAVANGSPPQVLVFAGDGSLVTALGAQGDGPGEFDRVTSIVPLAGDSLLAWDGWRLRMSVFTISGGFARDVSLREVVASTSNGWTRLLPTPSGALVAFTEAGMGRRQGVYRLEEPSHVIATTGEARATLGPFPGAELFGSDVGSGAVSFGAQTRAATSGDRLVVGTEDVAEVRVYGLDGTLLSIVRWPEGDRSVEGPFLEEYEAWMEGMIASSPENRRAWLREMSNAMPLAERLPAYGEVLGDSDGRIWVGAYPGHVANAGRARMPERDWIVFDDRGRVEATLVTPEGFRPSAVEEGRMWGVYRDELDVERVRAYPIEERGR